MESLRWHAQVKQIVLRGFAPGHTFERRSPYRAVVTVDFYGRTAVASSMLRADGDAISRRDMLQIAALVRQHGGHVMLAERDGRLVQISEPEERSTEPAELFGDTVPMRL